MNAVVDLIEELAALLMELTQLPNVLCDLIMKNSIRVVNEEYSRRTHADYYHWFARQKKVKMNSYEL